MTRATPGPTVSPSTSTMAAPPKRAKREKMSAVDTAWLRMDRPHNLMMISGVLMFREKVSLAA